MSQLKPVQFVPIAAPPEAQRASRGAMPAAEGEKRNRYHLPRKLESGSPVGFRTRVSLSRGEAQAALDLLSLPRPEAFGEGLPPTDGELFDECALGVLSARQSTNFRGHREVVLGPDDSEKATALLRRLTHLEGPVLEGATHTHLVLSRPYRTPFTLLLTFIGHPPVASLFTVPQRAWNKRFHHADDIPTIGYLQQLHVGILADAMERAAVLASGGTKRANVFMAPFSGGWAADNREAIAELEGLAGLTSAERREGWRLAVVAQVGACQTDIDPATCRRLGAALLALRSERIQPGVNQEERAPAPYQERQDMDVPPELVEMSGRAGYNAVVHWLGIDREAAKELMILDRIDVLTDGGKERLRYVRRELELVTDRVVDNLPLWADLLTGRALSRNAQRGRKAFALAGQRIYVGGLSRSEVEASGLDWTAAIRAFGAAAARSAMVAEIAGSTEIPEGCDLLGGICLMAGPVNQNDVGKSFYGMEDLLAVRHKNRDPTSLLVWTLKAKTVADPIGNEEQLLNPARKGALVDLRPAPHEVVALERGAGPEPFRAAGSTERAFAEVGNFVLGADGTAIPGNVGSGWPERHKALW